ncbi:MAG: SGNH hydrolase domain-containing protein [Desulforhabdus sp.]|nr:SGNH hydrolase domain-containing protein [Desulforhabdus sp.]
MAALFFVSRFVVASDGLPHRSAVESISAAEAQLKREPQQDLSCLALFSAGEAPVYCRQENSRSRMIAIIGDSHAHVLFPGVAMVAAENGYGTLLLANSGCPPFDGAVTGRNAVERKRCSNSIETILSTIERDLRIEAIVIASRGPQYMDGTGFGPAEATYNYPPISSASDSEVFAQASPRTVFRAGLERSIVRLRKHGERIAYVLQVPELGVPARNCLQRPWTLSRAGAGCEVDYKIYQERMRDYRLLVEELRSTQNYLNVIDLEPLFCDAQACSGYRDGQLLYADDNHLSVLGSIRAAPRILDVLKLDVQTQSP